MICVVIIKTLQFMHESRMGIEGEIDKRDAN